jgi:hypothetical protein
MIVFIQVLSSCRMMLLIICSSEAERRRQEEMDAALARALHDSELAARQQQSVSNNAVYPLSLF